MTIKQAVSWLSQPGILAMIHDPTTKKAVQVAIKALSATDKNVGTKLSTNLAEVGTDLAKKQTVKGFPIDADLLMLKVEEEFGFRARDTLYEIIRNMPKYELPSAQPEIIYCKDCVKHNKGLGNYEVHPDGSTTWIWKDSACPLVSWRDKAQGHEFDYQFCAYAERREVTE